LKNIIQKKLLQPFKFYDLLQHLRALAPLFRLTFLQISTRLQNLQALALPLRGSRR